MIKNLFGLRDNSNSAQFTVNNEIFDFRFHNECDDDSDERITIVPKDVSIKSLVQYYFSQIFQQN